MKSLIPVVMAGILGIYGMIVAVIISQRGTIHSTQSNTTMSTPTETDFLTWLQALSAVSAASYLFPDSGRWILDRKSGRRWYSS